MTEQVTMSENGLKLARATFGFIGTTYVSNPWSPDEVDKMESGGVKDHDDYHKLVKECRFFYRKDSIVSTVINKLVEIGITDLVIEKGKLSENEHRIFMGIKDKLQEFAENCALEYLISGLVIPEIKYAVVSKDVVKDLGIKKYSVLTMPVSMWLRDPGTVKINSSMVMDQPSYYVQIPEELIWFIQNQGTYKDGTKDPQLYQDLLKYYPEFVAQVRAGAKDVLLENDSILRRRPISDSPYPTPYLLPAIEPLKHKRNLRKMDYSIAARVISAIQLFRLGNDEFPVTEDDAKDGAFDDIKEQMTWRYSFGKDVERIFQLFANHTLEIDWIMPDTSALLNEKKYVEVNDDIFFALGFPRILTTGESQRTGTSDPEFAALSPVKTMTNMQRKILEIIKNIIKEIGKQNNLVGLPEVRFKPVSLHSFRNFVEGLRNLYDTRNLSRTTYADAFGYNWDEEARTLAAENDTIEELGIEVFAPKPFSPQPGGGPAGQPEGKPTTEKKESPNAGGKQEK